jgi:mevalonate kinase
MKITGFGYGKIILLGEHFVVHGLPALVSALPFKTVAQLQEIQQKSFFHDQRPKVPSYQVTKSEKYQAMLEQILAYLGIKKSLEVTLSGDLVVTSGGIGASAATAVALVRALDQMYDLKLPEDQIHAAAFHGECAVHGTPSGVDTTAAMHGGFFLFKKGDRSNQFLRQSIKLHLPLHLVLVDSGIVSDTKAVVTDVNALKLEKPHVIDEVFRCYELLVDQARNALEKSNLEKFGLCLNENHGLLQRLGVSCSKLDDLVRSAHYQGALGAKLTGTGQGGLVIALMPDQKKQEGLTQFFQEKGYFSTCIILFV